MTRQPIAHAIAAMKKLHKIIKNIATSTASGKDEKLKLLWDRWRSLADDVGLNSISMNNDRFKQYAWSTDTKGLSKRVFNQIADFGVAGDYDVKWRWRV